VYFLPAQLSTQMAPARYRWSFRAGQEQLPFERPLGSGAHCLRVWAADRIGRLSDASATLRLDIE
jgi:hypothetical protein